MQLVQVHDHSISGREVVNHLVRLLAMYSIGVDETPTVSTASFSHRWRGLVIR